MQSNDNCYERIVDNVKLTIDNCGIASGDDLKLCGDCPFACSFKINGNVVLRDFVGEIVSLYCFGVKRGIAGL